MIKKKKPQSKPSASERVPMMTTIDDINTLLSYDYGEIPPNRTILEFANAITPKNWNVYTNDKRFIRQSNILNIKLEIVHRYDEGHYHCYGMVWDIRYSSINECYTNIRIWKSNNWAATITHELAHVGVNRLLIYYTNVYRKNAWYDANMNERYYWDVADIYREQLYNKPPITIAGRRLRDLNIEDSNHGPIFHHYYKLLADRICKRYCHEPYLKQYGYCPERETCSKYFVNAFDV